MTPDQLAGLARALEGAEGRVDHLYLDSARPAWVTVGVGHRLTTVGDALALAFEPRDQVAGDFARVAAAQPGLAASAYAGLCRARLSQAAIDALLAADVRQKLAELERCFPAFGGWPDPVQLAVADMAFNLGTGGLIHKFPRLVRALDRRDWAACAAECHRQGIAAARNERTAQRFRAAEAA